MASSENKFAAAGSSYEPIDGNSAQPSCSAAQTLKNIIALLLPFPYAIFFGISGSWNFRGCVAIFPMCICRQTPSENFRSALTLWSFIMSAFFIAIFALSHWNYILMPFAYYLINFVLLAIFFFTEKCKKRPEVAPAATQTA